VEEFEGRISAKVRRQEKLNIAEERNFRKGELAKKIYSKNVVWVG